MIGELLQETHYFCDWHDPAVPSRTACPDLNTVGVHHQIGVLPMACVHNVVVIWLCWRDAIF